MSESDDSERVTQSSGPLGDGQWSVVLDAGFVDVLAMDSLEDVCRVRRLSAQHLRDFARNLESAADYLEGK